MKILQITPSLINGGAERFIVDLSNKISLNGHDVTLISLEGKLINDLSSEIHSKVNLVRLNKKRGFDFNCFKTISETIYKNEFDIIHTHTRSLNYVNPLCLMKVKAKFIHTIHNDAQKEEIYYLIRQFRKALFKLKLVFPVTISHDSDLSFEKCYNAERKLIFNGTRLISKTTSFDIVKNEVNGYKINDKTKIFVNIARVSEQKNQEMLINIFNRLQSESENVILLIVGRLTDKNYLKKINQILPSNVFILNSRNNATDFLFIADAFCLSSKWEGMPISLIESFCCGTIPICTPAGGIKNMIENNFNGFISENLTENSLYKQIIAFLSLGLNKAETIKRNCISSFEKKYSMDICSKNYLKLYKSLLR